MAGQLPSVRHWFPRMSARAVPWRPGALAGPEGHQHPRYPDCRGSRRRGSRRVSSGTSRGSGRIPVTSAAGCAGPPACPQRCRRAGQPRVKTAPQQIWMAETRSDADEAFDRFLACHEARHPEATGKLIEDREDLMSFFDFPAGHWQSIRTAIPVESTFATTRTGPGAT